jgi:ribose/xylose/arabinose/galactoside ABC-type transport system permease subunit
LSKWATVSGRLRHLEVIGVLCALSVICVALSLTTESFLQRHNLLQVARQASYYGIMAVGMVFLLAMGDIDLSVGSTLTLVNVLTAMALLHNWPIPAAIVAGLAVGALCGLLNGLLSVVLRIPTIVVTLGTLSVYRGLALVLCSATPISRFGKDNWFFEKLGGDVLGAPASVWVMLLVCVSGYAVFNLTAFGRHVQAIGGNPQAARLSGIPLARRRIGAMTLMGLISAIAGIMALAFLQSGDPNTGAGFELLVIASALIGGTPLTGGSGSVVGAILGALTIAVIGNGLILLDVPTYWTTVVTGAVIVLAVALGSFIRR